MGKKTAKGKGKARAAPTADEAPAPDAPAPAYNEDHPLTVIANMSQEHINSLQKNVPTQEKLPEVLEPVRSANVVGNQATQKTFDELFHAPAGSLGKWKMGIYAQDGGKAVEVRCPSSKPLVPRADSLPRMHPLPPLPLLTIASAPSGRPAGQPATWTSCSTIFRRWPPTRRPRRRTDCRPAGGRSPFLAACGITSGHATSATPIQDLGPEYGRRPIRTKRSARRCSRRAVQTRGPPSGTCSWLSSPLRAAPSRR